MKVGIEKMSAIPLAGLMIVFGLNKFIGFVSVAPPANPVAQSFLGSMFSSYLFVIVAIAEILGGVLLVMPKTKFLGWFILGPVIFNIVAFHISHDFIGNGIWIAPTVFYAVVSYGFREKIKSAFFQ